MYYIFYYILHYILNYIILYYSIFYYILYYSILYYILYYLLYYIICVRIIMIIILSNFNIWLVVTPQDDLSWPRGCGGDATNGQSKHYNPILWAQKNVFFLNVIPGNMKLARLSVRFFFGCVFRFAGRRIIKSPKFRRIWPQASSTTTEMEAVLLCLKRPFLGSSHRWRDELKISTTYNARPQTKSGIKALLVRLCVCSQDMELYRAILHKYWMPSYRYGSVRKLGTPKFALFVVYCRMKRVDTSLKVAM